MPTKIAFGTIRLNGVMNVDITGIDRITESAQIFFRPLGDLKGTLTRSEIRPGSGFALSSTSDDDRIEVAWEVWD
jgi:hypothetical protein